MPHHGEQPEGVGGLVHFAGQIDSVGMSVNSGPSGFADLVTLVPIDIWFPVTVDRVGGYQRAFNGTGLMRVAIYEDNGNTPVGGALIVESAAVADARARAKAEALIANTPLLGGRYWLAINRDNIANTFMNYQAEEAAGGTWQTLFHARPFGPFADPCPASALTTSAGIRLYVRVASVP